LDYYADLSGRDLGRFQVIKTSRFDRDFSNLLPSHARRVWCYLDPIQHFRPMLAELQNRYGLRVVMEESETRLSHAGLVLLEQIERNKDEK
jgi:hypothetical protein